MGQYAVHQIKTAEARQRDEKRKVVLRQMLRKPGRTGWRSLKTMASVIGTSEDEAARLLIEIDARGSETGTGVWAFIKDKPLPTADD
ncbi:MAG TPA: hypothetical protein VLG14_16725 [Sphingomonas sp.]|nr:hypothetical protein [Sphingomonas sp.]